MVTDTRVWPDVAIPPGEFLAETLESLGLNQRELARRSGRPAQAINEIVRGTKEITPETALQFERVLGVPAHIWTRLEADYQYVKARLEDRERLKKEIPLARHYPYAEMAAFGWVARTRNELERVQELLEFFGVASLGRVPKLSVSFRRSEKIQASHEALAVWLRQGERLAQQIETEPFSSENLRAALSELRGFTRQPAETFQPKLTDLLGRCGVAFVIVPHLRRTGAHGATRWITTSKALVQMSIRYRWNDIFWFGLIHELGHVLRHGRGGVFIEDHRRNAEEDEADSFAMDTLIPPKDFAVFVRTADFSSFAIRRFADRQGIDPGIVVGRLQHEGHMDHSTLNGLRVRFTLVA